MLIDLSDPVKVEINTMGGWAEKGVDLRVPFKIERLFFRTENGYRQHLEFKSRWIGDHYPNEYTVSRPATLIPNITRLCVMHNAKHTWASAWPARFDLQLGIVLWRVSSKKGLWEDDPERAFWVSLWDQVEEDQDQLSFGWRSPDPAAPARSWDRGRFDMIG